VVLAMIEQAALVREAGIKGQSELAQALIGTRAQGQEYAVHGVVANNEQSRLQKCS
jgi:hypothetical protein